MHSPASHAELTTAIAVAAVAFILLAGWLFGSLARRVGQPAVVGEIIAGIVLGPSVLGLLPGHLTDVLFPAAARPMLNAISQIGLLLFMFMVGWEFDRSLLQKRRTAAAAVSLSSVTVAFALGAGLAVVLYANHSTVGGKHVSGLAFALFLGAAMAITAFPVLARILTDSRLINTRVGALTLASAAVDDLLAWCVLALVSAIATASGNGLFAQTLALSLAYVAVMLFAVRPLLALLFRRLARGRALPHLLVLVAAGVFLSAYATTWIGIHPIFGAFLFGLVTPREPADELQLHLRRPLGTVGRLLMPVFFIVTGLGVDIAGLTWRNVLELLAILAVACAGKLIGAAVPAFAMRMPLREVGAVGLLMNARGLTELIILNAGVSLGVLDTSMFTMMVIMAVFTTALVGPLLPKGLERTPATNRDPATDREPAAAVPPGAEPAVADTARSAAADPA
ncbi:cation:proton antiporter domain-containing protein [Dactylosporangium darangshiense]|uniref:Cation/H+ exchanger transmembrane domain-containing protein n=1 Tax=Dactylosporangium darangshiense TaxID=579108 RepID=A0ABP8DDS1_9ACTN